MKDVGIFYPFESNYVKIENKGQQTNDGYKHVLTEEAWISSETILHILEHPFDKLCKTFYGEKR